MKKYDYKFSKNFERKSSKLFSKDSTLRKKFYKVLKQLCDNPFVLGLKTHKVNTPKWGKSFSSKITKDLRVVWKMEDGELVILIVDIGGHSGSKSVY